jgi:hypothetical protein
MEAAMPASVLEKAVSIRADWNSVGRPVATFQNPNFANRCLTFAGVEIPSSARSSTPLFMQSASKSACHVWASTCGFVREMGEKQ